MRTDLHQHVWTEPLLDALAARRCAPFVRRSDGLTVLHCSGELPCVIDEAAESPAARARLLAADRLDQAVVAISSPIGIETLLPDAAAELIAAHLDGVLSLGDPFRAWGPIPSAPPSRQPSMRCSRAAASGYRCRRRPWLTAARCAT